MQRFGFWTILFLYWQVAHSDQVSTLVHRPNYEAIRSGASCDATIRKVEVIPRSKNIYHQTLLKLFNPDDQSFGKQQMSQLSQSFMQVKVKNRVAILEFKSAAMRFLNGANCTQRQVKAIIEKTLLEFADIEQVEYKTDGKVVREWDA